MAETGYMRPVSVP